MSNNKSLTYIDLERLILFIILLILAYRFIQITAEVLILFTLVFLIVLLLNPVVVWIEKKGLSRTWAAILSVLGVLIIIAIIMAFALPPLIRQINLLIKDIPAITESLLGQIKQFANQFPFLEKVTSQLDVSKILSAPPIFTGIAKVSQNIIAFLFFIFLSIFLIVFVLANPKPLLVGFFQFFPEEKINRVREGLILLSQNLSTWFYSALTIGIINGFIAGTGLLVIGVFIIVQALEATVWSPLIIAHRLELHPTSIVFGILAAEAVLGLAGALLAVPILLIIKIFYYEFYEREFPKGFLETESEEVMEMELKHRHQ